MSSVEGQQKEILDEGEDNLGKNLDSLNEDLNPRYSDETEALLEELLTLEKEKIRLAKSSGKLSRQQLLQRVSDLQLDVAHLRNNSDNSLKQSTYPPDTARLPSYESSTGDSAVTYSSSFDDEYEGYEEGEDDSLSSTSKDNSNKNTLKPKRLDKLLQRHSESSAISPTLHVHHASVLQHRPASFRLIAANHHKHGQGCHGSSLTTASSPPHSSCIDSNRFASSENGSSGINNLVTPLITMPNALNYAVTLRDKRQHGINTASTYSPDRSANNSSSSIGIGINNSNNAASGVGSRDRRSSIHAMQARYRSGGHNNSGGVSNANVTNHADALLMMKMGDQGHYFSDSASDHSSNSRNASVDRTISPDHPQQNHPNIFISAPNNNNNNLATSRQDTVSTTSSSASSLLQDQANFLDPDFTHTYLSPHKPPIDDQHSHIKGNKNILEFCIVEADWQYLRGLQSAKIANPPGKNMPLSSAINRHTTNNMNNTMASVLNSFVPPCMIDRFPADIIHDKNSHTRDIQEQSFFFPSGVQVELVSHCVRDVTTRPYYHKRHIVPFTNRDGTPLYACCLTVQQSYQVEDIYALDPLIIDHLVKQYQAKYAATSIQKTYRAYLNWKKQQLWTQSSNTKPGFAVNTSTSYSTSATASNAVASTSFFATGNTRSTPRQSTATSSFFGNYQSNSANSNANSMYINNSVQSSQRLSGKGSDMGSVNGNANGFNSPTISNANHHQQQALIAQHHLKTSNIHKELLNNNATNKPSLFSRFFRTNSTSNPAAHATADTEMPTGTHSGENLATVTTNNPAVPAVTSTPHTSNISISANHHISQPNQISTPSANGVSGGGIFSPAAPLPPDAHTAVASSPHTVVSRLGFFRTSITGNNPTVAAVSAIASASLAASTSTPNSAAVTITTATAGAVTLPSIDNLRITIDSASESNSGVGSSGLLTPHRHDMVRLPSDIQRSFDQDDEGEDDDGNDSDESNEKEEKTKQKIVPNISHVEAPEENNIESEKHAYLQLNNEEKGVNVDNTGANDIANSHSNNVNSSKKTNPQEVPLPRFWELPLPPYAMDDSDTSPSNKTASSRYRKKNYYHSRFNLIHDSTFFMDKVVVGQRCYCLISPLPEYTFLFTMLDAIAQAEMQMHRPLQLQQNPPHQETAVTLTTSSEKEDISSCGMNATVNIGQYSHSKGSTHVKMDPRHIFLQQVSDYMHRFLSRPGNVLHVQDFALNFAVTQDLQLSGIRNRVLEKLAFRRHHHAYHNQHISYSSEKGESQIAKDAFLTEDDTESLQQPHSNISDSNNTAGTNNKARSKSPVVPIHAIHHKQGNKSHSHSHGHHSRRVSHSNTSVAAAKYALRVRDYCKISHHYLDSLVPTSEWALAVLITHVSAQTIFKMVNLLLMEKSLIIYGHHAGVVTAITFAIAQLLSPFLWEGIFIPLVPDNAREMFGAPVPLLLGTTSPPRLADVSSSTAVLHLNDHMATIYYDNTNSMVSASSSSATGAATTNNSNTSQSTGIFSTPNASFQRNTSGNTVHLETTQVPVSEKIARIRNVEFTAWFVRLPEVTADLPIDSEIVKRIDYTRKLLGQYAKEGVHFCYPWKELVAEFAVHKKPRKNAAAETANKVPNNNSNDGNALAKASDDKHDSPSITPSVTVSTEASSFPKHSAKCVVIPLKDETLDIHNQIDRLLLAHIPYIIRTQLRIILSVMKRYNATMCGTETFYDDPTTWKRFLRVNPVTQTEEFYPDNYLEPLRSKLEFQDAMVHTQLFVSFMDRLRREATILDQVREFIGHWIYCRIMVKRTQHRRKENKSRFRSILIPDSK